MWNNIVFDFNYSINYNFSFPHSYNDVLIHLSHWQYWWWFWFTCLITLYYVIILKFVNTRSLKFNPKITSSYRSHGKWGDMLICILPISWCLNILTNSTTLLKILEWQSEANFFTMRVRGKQWYWVYKFDIKSMNNSVFSFDLMRKIGTNSVYKNNLSDTDYIYHNYIFNFWNEKYLDKTFKENLPQQAFNYYKISFNSYFQEKNFWYSNNATENILFIKPKKITLYIDKTNNTVDTWNLNDSTKTNISLKKNCSCIKETIIYLNSIKYTTNNIIYGPDIFTELFHFSRIGLPSIFYYFYEAQYYKYQRTDFNVMYMRSVNKNFYLDKSYNLKELFKYYDLAEFNEQMMINYLCRTCINNINFFKINSVNLYFWKFNDFYNNYVNFTFKNNVFEFSPQKCVCDVCHTNVIWDSFVSDLKTIPNLKTLDPRSFPNKNKVFVYEMHKIRFNLFDYSKKLNKNHINLKGLYFSNKINKYNFDHIINRWWRNVMFKKNNINLKKLFLHFKEHNTNNLFKFNFIKNKIKSFTGNYYGVVKQKSINSWEKFAQDSDSSIFFNKNFNDLSEDVTTPFNANQIQMFNNMRLLKLNRVLVVPSNLHINIITNSFDVIHSWFLPGLGLKMDCVPGRSTHHTLYIDNPGMYYGQCAEICGRFHHHMPIRLCAMLFEHYYIWWYHIFTFVMTADDIETKRQKFNSKLNSFIKW